MLGCTHPADVPNMRLWSLHLVVHTHIVIHPASTIVVELRLDESGKKTLRKYTPNRH